VKERFLPTLGEDPRRVSIDEKLDLARRYNSIPLSHEKVATTATDYMELAREKYFVNTEGSEVRKT